MVVFICDGCGETLKKAKVDQHAARCRDCASVSCVDCSLSFWGGECSDMSATLVCTASQMMDTFLLLETRSHQSWEQTNVLIKL